MSLQRRGFTLIELLIVVVIIGILAAIAIPKFANSKERAYITAMRSDLRNLATAQESYYADHNGQYATATSQLTYRSSAGVTVTIYSVSGPSWRGRATHNRTSVGCRIRFGTTISNDGEVVCQ